MAVEYNIVEQAERIKAAAKRVDPSYIVKFDPNTPHNHLQFSIWSANGVRLGPAFHSPIHVNRIAEMPDEQLKTLIQQFASQF